jgi:YggT family protein
VVSDVIRFILYAYLVILGGRAILSWFPLRQGTFMASLYALLIDLTEPVLRPVRRVIPPAGMLDTSFMVVFFALVILLQFVK